MSQEELQLKLLHQKHIQNMLYIQKQRQLLNQQNTYTQTTPILPHPLVPQQKHLPILHPDSVIEKLLYYPPSQGESKVAERMLQSILSNWNRDCESIPENVHYRNMLKSSDRSLFAKQLTAKGRSQIDEMILRSKKDENIKTVTIRQKYSQKSTHPLFGPTHDTHSARHHEY